MKFPNASESFKKLNPAYFGVGQFQPEIRQQKAERTLDGKSSGCKTRSSRVDRGGPVARVTLTAHRRRICDDDNIIAGFKPLRDSIARWLGLDDNQKFIEWEYSQVLTRGTGGTAVKIEFL